jgi:hypothetical protein
MSVDLATITSIRVVAHPAPKALAAPALDVTATAASTKNDC